MDQAGFPRDLSCPYDRAGGPDRAGAVLPPHSWNRGTPYIPECPLGPLSETGQ